MFFFKNNVFNVFVTSHIQYILGFGCVLLHAQYNA